MSCLAPRQQLYLHNNLQQQGGCEALPSATVSCCKMTCEYTELEKKKVGTRPNHHFKSHIIHLDGNYNSTEGHCALFCFSHCTYVMDNSLPAPFRVEKTKQEGHFIQTGMI